MTIPNDNVAELTPVQRDLLRVLRAVVNGRSPDNPPADWAAVLDLASAHGVAGFLYSRVRAWDRGLRPEPPLMARWRTSFLGAASEYARVVEQVREALAALRAAGVRVVPLKGVWLAERVYDEGAGRPMSDIDLLVPADGFARARAALDGLGYSGAAVRVIEPRMQHIHCERPGAPLRIELHWKVWREGIETVARPDPSRMWEDLREESLHGVPVSAFPPERHLTYLAYHILVHNMAVPLRAYLDVVLLCRRYGPRFDPVRLNDEAGAWRMTFGAKFVAQVAADICGGSPSALPASFAPSGDGCEEARGAALHAALQLSPESQSITPSVMAFDRSSRFRRMRIGLDRILLCPDDIRLNYRSTVRRFGLAGGYVWRCADVLLRYGRALRRAGGGRIATDDALANFAARQALGAWVRARDGVEDGGVG